MKRLEFWAFLLFCLFRVRKMMTNQGRKSSAFYLKTSLNFGYILKLSTRLVFNSTQYEEKTAIMLQISKKRQQQV